MKIEDALMLVKREINDAIKNYKPFNSPHEGWAVIYEEVLELFDEIRKKDPNERRKGMVREAVQVAAMATRFLMDLGEEETTEKTDEEYRLQQYLKWKGGWEAIYYALTTAERIRMFKRLQKEIEEWEREEARE